MADQRHQYLAGLQWLAEGGDLTVAGQLEVALILQGSDVPTLKTASVLSDFDSGTLLEHDGTGAARKVLVNVTGVDDTAEEWRTYFHDDIAYPLLGSSSFPTIGVLYYVKVTDDTDSIPLSFNDRGGFPLLTNSSDWTLAGAEGFYRLGSRNLLSLLP